MIKIKSYITVIVCNLCFLSCAGTANSESFDLWGKYTGKSYQGNTITLKKEATIINVWSNASGYTIYRIESSAPEQAWQQPAAQSPKPAETYHHGAADIDSEIALPGDQQAYQDYITAYNKLTGLMAAGKGETLEAQAAYNEYIKQKEIYDASLTGKSASAAPAGGKSPAVKSTATYPASQVEPYTPQEPWQQPAAQPSQSTGAYTHGAVDIDIDTEVSSPGAQQAYQNYIASYNKLTSLMAAGKGDTPAAKAAYNNYIKQKQIYEASL